MWQRRKEEVWLTLVFNLGPVGVNEAIVGEIKELSLHSEVDSIQHQRWRELLEENSSGIPIHLGVWLLFFEQQTIFL